MVLPVPRQSQNWGEKMLGDQKKKCLIYHTKDSFLCLFSIERAYIVVYIETFVLNLDLQDRIIGN